MRRSIARAAGFTLIELMIVVTIVAVLSMVGVVAYNRYKRSARMGEATAMLTNIRMAQNEFKAETGSYANVSNSLASFYPNTNPSGVTKTAFQWGADCTNCVDGANGWRKLKVQTPGAVLFTYATVAGATTAGATTGFREIDAAISQQNAVLKTGDPWFIALAEADSDANGIFCGVAALSHTNQIIVSNDGE